MNLPEELSKRNLVSSDGIRYLDFRKTLVPHYGLVWLDICLGHLTLWLSLGSLVLLNTLLPYPYYLLLIPVFSPIIGYIMHYLHLFMHEGSHYNLAKDRKLNDLLADITIGLFVGMNMKSYRPTHFNHHRHLGTPKDTEISYFDPLNIKHILKTLLGLKVISVMGARYRENRHFHGANAHAFGAYVSLIVTVVLHGGIALTAFFLDLKTTSISWTLGVFAFFPFFGWLRTILEHRSESADSMKDYRLEEHGTINRLFGTGAIACTFGNAGFNRHLLHHWEPQVSYTRLADLEEFLLKTQEGQRLIEPHRTTYLETFTRLFKIGG